MPNFVFEFTDTTIQEVETIIEADDQEQAEEKFYAGMWEARIKSETVEDRSEVRITQQDDAIELQQIGWRIPNA